KLPISREINANDAHSWAWQVRTGGPAAGRRGRWSRRWAACCEIELTDARVPVKTARCRLVFVHMPEGHAIGRIDGTHAIVAPAAAGVGLATRTVEHYSFPLAEVIRRVSS